MLFEKSFRLIIGVFVSSMLARFLGPSNFGELNFYISLLSIATVLSSLGFSRIIVREVTKRIFHPNRVLEFITTAFFLRLLSSVSIWLIAVIISLISFDGNTKYIFVIFFSLIFISFDTFDFYAQASSKFKIVSLCRFFSFLLSSCFKLILIYFQVDLFLFIFSTLLEYIITALMFYLFLIKPNKLSLRIQKFNFYESKILLKESWPEIIAGCGAILFMRIDQIFLQVILGDNSVGIYTAGTRITEAWYFLPTAIVAATFPKLVSLKEESYEKYMAGVKIITSVLVLISIIVAITFTFTSNYIVNILYGNEYIESAHVIILHTWGSIFLCMGISSGSWLVAEKKLKLNLARNIFGLVICALANYILIPLYGVQGSAISTVIGMASAFYLFDIFHPQLRRMFIIKTQSLLPIQLINLLIKKELR
uniref:Flippase n=1 Tax=Providencia stuartii TaxID=588 RepID=A0AAI9DEI2_PROST|nr:flippase [Providencia stuartii]